MGRWLRWLTRGVAAASVVGAMGATSAVADTVSVELNKLEPSNGACRAYLVVQNGGAHSFETLRLDMVMFDTDGIVARRLAVEAAPLPAGKMSLKVFDVDGLGCEGIGRVLLNDVLSCRDQSGEVSGCLEMIAPSSRTDAALLK